VVCPGHRFGDVVRQKPEQLGTAGVCVKQTQTHGSVRSGPNRFRDDLESSRRRVIDGVGDALRIHLDE
jgi:hypothetical protein